MFDAGSIVARITADINGLTTNLSIAKKHISSFVEDGKKNMQSFSSTLIDQKDKLKEGAIALSAFGAIGVASLTGLVKAADNVEQLNIAFTTMLGSAEKAQKLISEMNAFAKTTPFSIQGVEEATKKLLAYGSTQDTVLDELRTLGDIASGVGKDKMPQLILAYGQVRAAGKLTGMELRQFTETGVPLLQELSKVTGMSVESMAGNIADLNIPFETVQQALNNLSGEGGKFFNLMEQQSMTFSGRLSNIFDSLSLIVRDLGEPLLSIATIVTGEVAKALEFLQEKIENANPKVIQFLAVIVSVTSAFALLAAGILGALATLASILGTIVGVQLAFAAFGITITGLITTVGLFILPITGVIVALGLMYTAWKTNFLGIRDITATVWQSVKDAFSLGALFIQDAFYAALNAITLVFDATFEGIKETFKSVVNYIVDQINALIGLVNGVTSKLSFGKIKGGISTIPKLAEGGIVTKPTLAMIGEGGESEAVIPLSKLNSMGGAGGVNIIIQDSLVTDEETAKNLLEKAFNSMNLAL